MSTSIMITAVSLIASSTVHAQSLNTPRFNDDRPMIIESFSWSTSEVQEPAPPDTFESYELPVALEDTFTLHSNPGATKVVYLDFDGHTIMWRGEEFHYDAWNMEGPDATFSDTERTIIQLIWQSISEDFLPFDLDVTTEYPGLEALKNTGGMDEEWGIRVVINHSTDRYSWAYTDSFNDSEDTEMYAWTGPNPSSIEETWIWTSDSVSHEAGHALGLSHDGTKRGVEYYEGHGTGDNTWSPIMGWTNYGLSQWARGEYTDANNQEDDIEIITTQNGFGFRADDHGSDLSTATPIDIYGTDVSVGIIERSDDIDFFAFSIDVSGSLKVTFTPDSLSPNLDIEASILDSEGALLQSSNPPTAIDAELEIFLVAGDYFLSVDGAGYDDPDSDGYSDYGSLGYYEIRASFEGDPVDTGDSGLVVDTDDSGELGTPDEEVAGGCSCSSDRVTSSGALFAVSLCLVLIRRRRWGQCAQTLVRR